MPKDHYIAQTYLKHFTDPALKCQIHAYSKANLSHFTPTPRNICCQEGWDTNPFLKDNERVVGEYLQIIEPRWDAALENFKAAVHDEEAKYFMAGYVTTHPHPRKIKKPSGEYRRISETIKLRIRET